jgi:YD repeat-containing protein
MTPIKVAATLLVLATGIFGGFLVSAQATQAVNWTYYGNQLIQVDFDDGTSIQYGYDENGNRVTKTYGNQFYTITASAGAGGTISPPGPVSVVSRGDCSFTAMPDPGYYVANIVVDGNSLGAATGYTFTNVTAAHTISASFVSAFPITVSVNGGGTITPTSTTVNYNASQTFTITANTGFYIANVVVDGASVGTPTSHTFANVSEPHSIAADFQIYTYSITTSVFGGGTITPTSPTVNFGASQTFTINPQALGLTRLRVWPIDNPHNPGGCGGIIPPLFSSLRNTILNATQYKARTNAKAPSLFEGWGLDRKSTRLNSSHP